MEDFFQILMEKQNQYYQIRQQKQQQLQQPQQKNYVQLDAKGLENKFGENNCFLNVVIQALWQLSSFRNKFNNWEKHSHKDEKQASNCVHCALKSVFIQYQYSETPLIPPTTLRSALHHTFANEERFQIGQMDDAAETLEAILNCLEDVSDEEDGIPRCVFGIDLEKSVFCANCKSQSKPEISSHFIEYTYSSPLLRLLAFQSNSREKNDRLENLIKIVGQEWKSCPREDSNGNPICKEKLLVTNKLLNVPEILAIGIVWETTQPSVDEILGTLNLIQNQITINRLFTLDYKNDIYFRFRGMICYYGKHYACYFFDEKIGKWIVFDDATVKIVGDWQNVLLKSKLGHFHPSVLLYERNPGQSVPPRVPVRIPEPNIQIPSIPEIQNKLLQYLNIHHDVSFSKSNDQAKKGYQTINVQSKTTNLPPPKKGYSYLQS